MLLFGHTGITAGVVKACEILGSMNSPGSHYQPDSSSKFARVTGRVRSRLGYLLDGVKGRIGPVDYRLVLVGSLLPDIIDKPVWLIVNGLAGNTSLCGRDYAHTLLFNLALFIGGLVLIRYGKSWLLIISLSSFMHLILDQLWNSPEVLLWPLLGELPKLETAGWLPDIFEALFSCPVVYIPELIGLVVILLFAGRLVRKKGIIRFIRDGAIR